MSAAAPQIFAPLLKLSPLSLPPKICAQLPKARGCHAAPGARVLRRGPLRLLLRCPPVQCRLVPHMARHIKVGLLAAGRGPLDPASPALHFVLAVALPIKLTSAGARSPRTAPAVATWSKAEQAESLVSCELKEGRSITEEALWRYLSKYTLEMLCLKKLHCREADRREMFTSPSSRLSLINKCNLHPIPFLRAVGSPVLWRPGTRRSHPYPN